LSLLIKTRTTIVPSARTKIGLLLQAERAQRDYPYGWAPIQLLAVDRLRRYGFGADADRITHKFLLMVLQNWRRDHTLREKYNVVTQSTETHIEAGYARNVTGFGWTNGVFLELLHESPPDLVARLQKE
jgi:alpha,alpha-trehalase